MLGYSYAAVRVVDVIRHAVCKVVIDDYACVHIPIITDDLAVPRPTSADVRPTDLTS